MPLTAVMWFAPRQRVIGFSTGMPPPTEASNSRFTRFSRASWNSSTPCSAISCLFAVTTCFPAWRDRRTMSSAAPHPPIVSTTSQTSGSNLVANGTGAMTEKTPAQVLSHIGAAPAYSYGTADLTAGVSALETGKLYFVYE